MGKKKKSKIEFRYYEMPEGSNILALLGQKWIQPYGEGIDYLHFHNYMEIGYCYEGQGVLTIGKENYRFSGEQFSVIPQNCLHTTTCDPGTMSRWEYLYIDVEGALKGLYPEGISEKRKKQMIQRINNRGFFKSAEEMPKMAEKILQMLNIMRRAEEFYKEEVNGVLSTFLAVLARENANEAWKAGDRNKKEQGAAMIATALDYISDHYMEPIRIEGLAKLCHISETHFRRIFSLCMRIEPRKYINMVRIQKACTLLKETDIPVADIAYKCGFFTLSTFNRNFKRSTGVSPHEWRKRPENCDQQLLKFTIHFEEGW